MAPLAGAKENLRRAVLQLPEVNVAAAAQVIVWVTDKGQSALARDQRVFLHTEPRPH